MHCIRKVTDDMYWIGGNDRRLALFENVYPIPRGVSYNSYVVLDEKTVLLDTVDSAVAGIFFENLKAALNGRTLDYLIVNHMEPDHCAMIEDVVMRYPEVQIVCNAKTLKMIKQFFDFEVDSRVILVKEMDTLCTGRHTFAFVMAPMVHWPEAMVTYDATDKILYSADAFGSFGAINGNIFADEVNFERDWLDDARRYYTNIVGKYGTQVNALLNKASSHEINMICPLHGVIIKENISKLVNLYSKWANYEAEINSVLIAYASVYGGTQNAAEVLATKLSQKGIKNIKMHDVSMVHHSFILSDAFKYSHIVIAAPTYNNGIFIKMEQFINDIVSHNLQNRTYAIIENGSWAPNCASAIKTKLETLKGSSFIENKITIKSNPKTNQEEEIEKLVNSIVNNIKKEG